MNQTLTDIGRSNKEIRDSLSLAVKLRSDFGSGVCLIAGTYYFVESGTGRPLRYPEGQVNESGGPVQSGGEPTTLTPDGKTAYVANPVTNDVSVVDLMTRQVVKKIPVPEKPLAPELAGHGHG